MCGCMRGSEIDVKRRVDRKRVFLFAPRSRANPAVRSNAVATVTAVTKLGGERKQNEMGPSP